MRTGVLVSVIGLSVLVTAGVVLPTSSGQRVDAAPAPPAARVADEEPRVRYGRDVRPILSDRCFRCHGPDEGERKAGLRIDLEASALQARAGRAAIVPGDVEASELWHRITAHDPDDLMPPASSNKKPLDAAEREIIRRWIEEGAAYEPHWAFLSPTRPSTPAVVHVDWVRTPVDAFVLAALEAEGLSPSPDADPATLLRRVFLDLTGLPPTPEESQAYLDELRGADDPDAVYERWVDRLLDEEPYRTRYAEHMTSPWLDQARYADTNGIHMDNGRSLWPWRDWVLDAYHANMPFDRFVVEQLAGDLVPEATQSQRIASGFNRNHVITDEGGVIAEEYLVEYAVDRVDTTGAVFLGLTLGCARCHDHKFDPISMEDYYGLVAFYNSNDEPGLYSQTQDSMRAYEPFISAPEPGQAVRLEELGSIREALLAERATSTPREEQDRIEFMTELELESGVAWATSTVLEARSVGGATLTVQPDGSVLASGANPERDDHVLSIRVPESRGADLQLLALEALGDASLPHGRVGRAPNGNAVLTGVDVTAVSVEDPSTRVPVAMRWAWADVEQANGDYRVVNAMHPDSLDGTSRGWAVDAHQQPGTRVALLLADEPFGFAGGTDLEIRLEYRSVYASHVLGRVRLSAGAIAPAGLDRLPVATGSWYRAGTFRSNDRNVVYDRVFGPETHDAIDLGATFDEIRWALDLRIPEAEVVTLSNDVGVEYLGRRVYAPTARSLDLSLGSDDGIRIFQNGEEIFGNRVDRGVAPDQERLTIDLEEGENTLIFKIVNTGGPSGFYHRADPPVEVLGHDVTALLLPEAARHADLTARADDAWRTQFSPRYRELSERLAALDDERSTILAAVPRTMVMRELPEPRQTYVLSRGQYDHPDTSRPVERSVPVALGALSEEMPRSRLGLAQWLTDDANPLVARVAANRIWALLFGTGIVRTTDDFGFQGEWPSHPELLDWLAVEFRDGGWDQKALLRRLVTSSTYRQASRVRPEAKAIDPDNRLLASFPRQRLTAEQLRDQALFIGGLLVERMGGPSVKPYQPEGLWAEIAMLGSNTRRFEQGMGEDLWRRSLYTYWKRAAPPPSMLTFDAPTREFCTTGRISTNTPLQALVLWNDVQFVEAARAAATRTLVAVDDDRERLINLHLRCTGHLPTDERLDRLASALQAFHERYAAAPDDAVALISAGSVSPPESVDPAELAAWTMIANALLATDAVIVKD